MKAKHVLTLTAAIATYSSQVHSNDFNLGLEFKTNHLWHGSIVTQAQWLLSELTLIRRTDNKSALLIVMTWVTFEIVNIKSVLLIDILSL